MKGKIADKLHGHALSLAAVLVVAMMLFPALGYAATSYQATTEVTGNMISTQYFTIGTYSYNSYTETTPSPIDCTEMDIGANFISVTMTTDESAKVGYYHDGHNNHIDGEFKLTSDNLFFILQNNSMPDGTTFKVKPRVVIDQESESRYGENCMVITLYGAGSADSNGYYTVNPSYAYRFSLSAVFDNYSCTDPDKPSNITFEAYLDGVASNASGICFDSRVVQMISSGSMAFMAMLAENNGGNITNSSGYTYHLYEGPDVGDYNSVGISGNDDGGIAQDDSQSGKVEVSVVVPIGFKFVIAFDYTNEKKDQEFILNVKNRYQGGEQTIISDKHVTLSGTGHKVVYLDNTMGAPRNVIDDYTEWIQITGSHAGTDKIVLEFSDIGNASKKILTTTKVYLVFNMASDTGDSGDD